MSRKFYWLNYYNNCDAIKSTRNFVSTIRCLHHDVTYKCNSLFFTVTKLFSMCIVIVTILLHSLLVSACSVPQARFIIQVSFFNSKAEQLWPKQTGGLAVHPLVVRLQWRASKYNWKLVVVSRALELEIYAKEIYSQLMNRWYLQRV